ncbi:Sporulation related domain protein [Vibrio thalassae]|uniref:Sporulation related domain protein n=1 Tax=Vibrio thalassae TaxID=1243014 RepID=A0A240ELI7_9VIBR|nr:SPOR domain-containing protein [Vibrio thalassae]SNX49009.1 Sporulation related domain protein [Vibrio thalassae]
MSSLNGVKGLGCFSFRALLGALLLTSSVVPLPVYADDVLCDASQPSTSALPVLDKSCPIGNGIWSSEVPVSSTSLYWIQCGILDAPMPLSQAKTLYANITTDVWMLPQSNSYRCLIGPYSDTDLAKQELTQVKALPRYRDAFIRQVERRPSATTPPQRTAKVMPPVSANAVAPKSIEDTTEQPVKKAEKITPLATSAQATLSVRLETTVNGLHYRVPYIANSSHQFYIEHDKAWNRLSYQAAIKVCSDLNMHLASYDEWQALIKSQLMQKNRWPLQMPYWGDGQKGLFTNGKVSPLKGNTLLNVVCVGKL